MGAANRDTAMARRTIVPVAGALAAARDLRKKA